MFRRCLAAALLAIAALAAHSGAATLPLSAQIEQVEQGRASARPQERVAALLAAYLARLPADALPGDCHVPAPVELKQHFAATAHIARYVMDAQWLARVRCLHPAMQRAFPADTGADRALLDLLIATRDFDQAREVAQRSSLHVPVLPEILDLQPQTPGLLLPVAEGRLQWVPWRLPDGWHVVAMVHPLCGFSRRAVQAMATDEGWGGLRGRLQLVVQRETRWSGEPEVRAWNSQHPDLPMAFQANAVGWDALDAYETPVFHLMHGTQRVSTIVGWQGEGQALAEAWRNARTQGGAVPKVDPVR